jgi:hypothetical protein
MGSTMTGLRPLSLVLLTTALTLLAGCGSSHHHRGSAALNVSVSEYRIMPQSVHVNAGVVTVVVHNRGRLIHNLVVSRDGHSQGSTKPIWPGASADLTLAVSDGSYLMASTIVSDQALGAYGTLQVSS